MAHKRDRSSDDNEMDIAMTESGDSKKSKVFPPSSFYHFKIFPVAVVAGRQPRRAP